MTVYSLRAPSHVTHHRLRSALWRYRHKDLFGPNVDSDCIGVQHDVEHIIRFALDLARGRSKRNG